MGTNEATATVFQQFSRTRMKAGRQAGRQAGRILSVDTSAVQNETWVRTPRGWKRRRIASVHARGWDVDGKRVDPNKPCDPDAPRTTRTRTSNQAGHGVRRPAGGCNALETRPAQPGTIG